MLNKELLFARAVIASSNEIEYTFSCKGIPKEASQITVLWEYGIVGFWVKVPCIDRIGSCNIGGGDHRFPDGTVTVSSMAYRDLSYLWQHPELPSRFQFYAVVGQQNIEPKSVVCSGQTLTKNGNYWETDYLPFIDVNKFTLEVIF